MDDEVRKTAENAKQRLRRELGLAEGESMDDADRTSEVRLRKTRVFERIQGDQRWGRLADEIARYVVRARLGLVESSDPPETGDAIRIVWSSLLQSGSFARDFEDVLNDVIDRPSGRTDRRCPRPFRAIRPDGGPWLRMTSDRDARPRGGSRRRPRRPGRGRRRPPRRESLTRNRR